MGRQQPPKRATTTPATGDIRWAKVTTWAELPRSLSLAGHAPRHTRSVVAANVHELALVQRGGLCLWKPR